jgi:hypothetical protein
MSSDWGVEEYQAEIERLEKLANHRAMSIIDLKDENERLKKKNKELLEQGKFCSLDCGDNKDKEIERLKKRIQLALEFINWDLKGSMCGDVMTYLKAILEGKA